MWIARYGILLDVLFLVYWIGCIVAAVKMAGAKNRSKRGWGICATLVGLFALIALAPLPKYEWPARGRPTEH